MSKFNIKILAHRGFWKEETEKNTKTAFERAFNSGFGIEQIYVISKVKL